MNGIVELAKILKARDNIINSGIQIGVVISPLPNIKIALGEKIILTKRHLVFASHILDNYQRKYKVNGSIQLPDVSTSYSGEGTIELTDGLETGDKVILIPTKDEQVYYVIDKAVSF
ncbi:DUF2577 domain-containing protein [Alkaliphilus peptidifermentans]|uniref:DUF2577 domain-containing protein n=1 Tax=Alkaliphilus peptidifermentans DSM 18978 TaxID=1120976 RepID=A0A1G5JYN9_9FIRM|nr:DUF2577 domain-containing protein [Alkaliphilus peptidifermentans]SCY92970.1 Protein of unknown function [Alkaliphilus peptidifermentans DSM 18978]